VRAAAVLAAALVCAGCDEMVRQPKAPVYGRSDLFPGGAAMQPPPAGTISRDQAAFDQALSARPPITPALLARGRERFGIYCAPCHGLAGDGDGVVPSRGFPRPPDFHAGPLRAASPQLIVDTISHGYGVMYAYGDRVAPADRWAIAAYIGALQLSQDAPAADLTADDRARVEAADAR